MNNDDRYGNILNLTPEQARNRQERRDRQAAESRATSYANEVERLQAENQRLRSERAAVIEALRAAAVVLTHVDGDLDYRGPYGEVGRLKAALAALPEGLLGVDMGT